MVLEGVSQGKNNTMSKSYDIVLEKEDYTIGKSIEHLLYAAK